MALPTETTGFTYGWSPNDFIQNFLAEGSDNRGGASKGAMESKLSILEGDVVQLGTAFREVKAYAHGTTTTAVVGVALADSLDGKMVPVACGPIVKCECGEAVTRGNHVGIDDGEDALIKPITLSGGATEYGYLGIALNAGDDGDVIPVLMKGPGIAHTG
jgi:hypothetical protein